MDKARRVGVLIQLFAAMNPALHCAHVMQSSVLG